MAWVYCDTETVLNKAQSKWIDNTGALRTKALGWLNEVIRDVLNQPRIWWFLKTSSSFTPSTNAITLPVGCGEVVSISGDDFFFTPDNQLTTEQVYELESTDYDSTTPMGYVQDGRTVTFYGGDVTTTVSVEYEADLTTDYADTDLDTIFPVNFENLFVTGVRMHYYDYDKDGRYGKENALYSYEMKIAKAWDNTLKPRQQKNPHGYTRVS